MSRDWAGAVEPHAEIEFGVVPAHWNDLQAHKLVETKVKHLLVYAPRDTYSSNTRSYETMGREAENGRFASAPLRRSAKPAAPADPCLLTFIVAATKTT